jgi:S-DNA-T family DNA segregation ATPase FtsK/SpoIIIE
MDPLYHEIKKYVQMQERISTSHLQRKFRIGYNRAAKIIEQLEENGTISSRDKYGFRTVLKRIYVWCV